MEAIPTRACKAKQVNAKQNASPVMSKDGNKIAEYFGGEPVLEPKTNFGPGIQMESQ